MSIANPTDVSSKVTCLRQNLFYNDTALSENKINTIIRWIGKYVAYNCTMIRDRNFMLKALEHNDLNHFKNVDK